MQTNGYSGYYQQQTYICLAFRGGVTYVFVLLTPHRTLCTCFSLLPANWVWLWHLFWHDFQITYIDSQNVCFMPQLIPRRKKQCPTGVSGSKSWRSSSVSVAWHWKWKNKFWWASLCFLFLMTLAWPLGSMNVVPRTKKKNKKKNEK